MAQPDQAQPPAPPNPDGPHETFEDFMLNLRPEDVSPDNVVLTTTYVEVIQTPRGTMMLAIHRLNHGEKLMVGLTDAEAERIAKQLVPSKVALPSDGVRKTAGGVVLE